jgi:hypothetical protein
MKIYVALHATPWEKFSIAFQDPEHPEKTHTVKASSNDVQAGFLPLFWRKEDAEKAFPDVEIQEAEVNDNWHPVIG